MTLEEGKGRCSCSLSLGLKKIPCCLHTTRRTAQRECQVHAHCLWPRAAEGHCSHHMLLYVPRSWGDNIPHVTLQKRNPHLRRLPGCRMEQAAKGMFVISEYAQKPEHTFSFHDEALDGASVPPAFWLKVVFFFSLRN